MSLPEVSYVALSASGNQLHVSGKTSGEQLFLDLPLPDQQHGESHCDKYTANQALVKFAFPDCQSQLSTEDVLLRTPHLVHFTEAALA